MGSVEHVEEVMSSDVIEPAEEVRQRWSEENSDFAQRLRQHNFQLFFSHRPPRITPGGERIFICTRGTVEDLRYEYGYGNDTEWCVLDNVCLLRSEVELHETKYPYLKYPAVSDNTSDNGSGTNQEEHIYMSADDICKRWSMSPAQLVDLIRSSNDLPVYWRKYELPF